MADSPTNSVRSETTPSVTFPYIFDDGSIEAGLPPNSDPLPSILNEPVLPISTDSNYEFLQGYSAPAQPFYINMTDNDSVRLAGTSANHISDPLSRSLVEIDVDHPQGIPIPIRPNHHHHQFPSHSQIRNRYPYLQRPINVRATNRTQTGPLTNSNGPLIAAQRTAPRRTYFALRRPAIPQAPPMPKNLFPGRPRRVALDSSSHDAEHQNDDSDDEEEQPPSKSFWVILRLVFFFFAIEFMYAVETALTVPIFSSLRVEEKYISMAWLISPILGFFLQPIVGMWSDTCKCQWGRRRPFILAFAIGAFIGIALLLNASDLGHVMGDKPDEKPIKAIIICIIGVTLLDFCADSADAPIRAYLIDTTNPSDQERGFNIHAILGFGGGLGFIIGAFPLPRIAIFHGGVGQFTVIFITVTCLFIACTLSTLTSIREEPLVSLSRTDSDSSTNDDEDEDDDEHDELDTDEKRPLLSSRTSGSRVSSRKRKPGRSLPRLFYNSFTNEEGFVEIDTATGSQIPHDYVEETSEDILLRTLETSHQLVAATMAASDTANPVPVPTQAFEAELKKKAKLVKLGLMRRPIHETTDEDERDDVTLKSMLISMVRMPPRLWKLMICQVIGWIAYFATHIYFTDFMAKVNYNASGDPVGTSGELSEKYQQGVKMGCWGLLVYAVSGSAYAFLLERWIAERVSLNTLYFIGYFVYAIGCIVNYYFHYVAVNIVMCFTFGIMVVTLNTLPYHMLSNFHADETYKNVDGSKRGIGVDCSLLNSCYFLGELIIAIALGPIVDKVGINYSMLMGAVLSLLGNLCMSFLFYFTK